MKIIEIRRNQNSFEHLDRGTYLKGENVLCIHAMPNYCLLLGIRNSSELQVLDLTNGQVIKKIPNPSKDSFYNHFEGYLGDSS